MNFESPNLKEQKWQKIEKDAERIIDSLHKRIDPKIKFAVVSLKANGLGTIASCEGHLNRGLPYPWVDVESQLAEQLLGDRLYNELKIKGREHRLSKSEKELKDKMIQAQKAENEKAYKRLLELLGKFYSQKNLTHEVKLGIEKFPWNRSRLQPEGMPNWHQRQTKKEEWSQEEKIKNLELYRKEMDRFAQFLKDKFFKS